MRAKAVEPARNLDVSDQGWNPATDPAATSNETPCKISTPSMATRTSWTEIMGKGDGA